MRKHSVIQHEAEEFDKETITRVTHGLIPDLRRLKKVAYFYNNPWREPEFVQTQIMPRVDFVLKHLKPRSRVLELGCGRGYLALELARHGHDVRAVDVSSESIAIAKKIAEENPYKKGFGSLKYEVGDIMNMDFGKDKHDAVIFFRTLHHIPRINVLLKKVHHTIKPGGRLIISEPLREEVNEHTAHTAALLRSILPTWEAHGTKRARTASLRDWQNYAQAIYDEYTYKDEHGEKAQSPNDNAIGSEKLMVGAIKKYFRVETLEHHDAFIDKLVGGLRGPHRHALARHLKEFDHEVIKRGMLPGTAIHLVATKK
ncbi:MAG: methyltransferase domain-containing protein [bacterium]|nr:methyltransferase domain-containing protein [bacterium]